MSEEPAAPERVHARSEVCSSQVRCCARRDHSVVDDERQALHGHVVHQPRAPRVALRVQACELCLGRAAPSDEALPCRKESRIPAGHRRGATGNQANPAAGPPCTSYGPAAGWDSCCAGRAGQGRAVSNQGAGRSARWAPRRGSRGCPPTRCACQARPTASAARPPAARPSSRCCGSSPGWG